MIHFSPARLNRNTLCVSAQGLWTLKLEPRTRVVACCLSAAGSRGYLLFYSVDCVGKQLSEMGLQDTTSTISFASLIRVCASVDEILI